jgi:glycosyltransferase involved in cell wall biosynthesis
MSAMSVTLSVTPVIPAFNEAGTVADIVRVAKAAGFARVLVVSDGSTDQTAALAKAAGAEVLELHPNRGKGGAVRAGAEAAQTSHLLLLDADLLHLRPEHLHLLLEPVQTGRAETTAGLFSGGGLVTDFGNRATPFWSGQRLIPTATILAAKHLASAGYGVEMAINQQIALEKLRLEYVNLHGVSQVMKEQKVGLIVGLLRRLKMYWQILVYATLKR